MSGWLHTTHQHLQLLTRCGCRVTMVLLPSEQSRGQNGKKQPQPQLTGICRRQLCRRTVQVPSRWQLWLLMRIMTYGQPVGAQQMLQRRKHPHMAKGKRGLR